MSAKVIQLAERIAAGKIPDHAMPAAGQPLPLPELWRVGFACKINFQSKSRQAAMRATRERSATLPDFPTAADCIMWVTRLRSELNPDGTPRYQPTTIQLEWDNMRALYAFGQVGGWAAANPFALAAHAGIMPKVKPQRQAIREIGRIWPFLEAVAADDRERAFLCVLRFGALRIGEVLALTKADIERDAIGGRWHLHVLRQRDRGSFEATAYPKTDASLRRIEVRDPLRIALKKIMDLPDPVVRVGRGGGEEATVPYLFPYRATDLSNADAKKGRAGDGILDRLRGIAADSFPPGDAWHVFRHTVAMELDLAGWSTVDIKEFLGHASVAKTETYLRSLLGNRAAIGKMDLLDAKDRKHSQKVARERRKVGRPRGQKMKPESALTLPGFEAKSPDGREEKEKFESLSKFKD